MGPSCPTHPDVPHRARGREDGRDGTAVTTGGAAVNVLMIAPPGAGKGTQGVVIAAHFDIPHIATGDLLRDHVARGTELGQQVREFLDRGELVPDEGVLTMVREALEATDRRGYVIDGSPRPMGQARARCGMGVEGGATDAGPLSPAG